MLREPPVFLLEIILAVILPPVAVGIRHGLGRTFVLNLILTALFLIPGIVHALCLVLRDVDEAEDDAAP